jgi:hypothetical protein
MKPPIEMNEYWLGDAFDEDDVYDCDEMAADFDDEDEDENDE